MHPNSPSFVGGGGRGGGGGGGGSTLMGFAAGVDSSIILFDRREAGRGTDER